MARKNLPSHPSRHPLYVPGLLSTAQISSLDWSKIINTPTTRDGYGITDVYTEAEADALFLTSVEADALFLTPAEGNALYSPLGHTHDTRYYTETELDAGQLDNRYYTETEVDGMFALLSFALDDLSDVNAPAPGDGDALTWDDSAGEWVATPLGGGGPHSLDSHTDVDTTGVTAGDVLTYDGADWIAQAPAAAGIDGVGSAPRHAYWTDADTLAASVMFEFNDPGLEEGISFAPNAGRVTISMQPDNVTPGQSADNPGWTLRADTDAGGGDFEIINNFDGEIPFYVDNNNEVHMLGPVTISNTSASLRLRESDQPADEKLWEFQAEANLLQFTAVNDAVNAAEVWMVATRGAGATIANIAWKAITDHKWYINGAVTATLGTGTLTLEAQDNALEGAEIVFKGGGNGGSPYASWNLDSWTGTLRMHSGGTLYHQFATNGVFHVNVFLGDVGHTTTWAGFSHNSVATTTSYAMLHKNDGSETRINCASGGSVYLCANNVQLFQSNASVFRPMTDGTLDLGSNAPNRWKDMWLAGEVVQPNGTATVAVDQASFANAQTNITNLNLALGANEEWIVDVQLSCQMATAATGVKFYFTGPAGMTGECHREGNVATVATWQSLYTAALTVPATFFVTGIIQGTYRIRATVRTGGTAGTLQLVGITGGATTTCVVRKGSTMLGHRKA
jgi:hypothetical protein